MGRDKRPQIDQRRRARPRAGRRRWAVSARIRRRRHCDRRRGRGRGRRSADALTGAKNRRRRRRRRRVEPDGDDEPAETRPWRQRAAGMEPVRGMCGCCPAGQRRPAAELAGAGEWILSVEAGGRVFRPARLVSVEGWLEEITRTAQLAGGILVASHAGRRPRAKTRVTRFPGQWRVASPQLAALPHPLPHPIPTPVSSSSSSFASSPPHPCLILFLILCLVPSSSLPHPLPHHPPHLILIPCLIPASSTVCFTVFLSAPSSAVRACRCLRGLPPGPD